MLRKFSLLCAALLAASSAFGQSAIVRGEASAGVYQNIATDGSQNLRVSIANQVAAGILDPCASSAVVKTSAVINITSATTTQLVAISGTTTIYVCSYAFTVSQVVTTPNTLTFVRGTGASCGTGTTALTGLYGDGGVTAAQPITIQSGSGATMFKTTAGAALCATTVIGASGSFQGVISYVQQ
jgi:hypothetical protein